jgi:hypothetical protein
MPIPIIIFLDPDQSFVVKALHENLEMTSNFLMFADLQATFAMFSLHYAQRLGYLLFTMFPSPSILQHYIEFDIHTIITLEKLLGAGSFGGYINHLTHHQAILLAFLGGLSLCFIIRTTTLTFLGCCALIALALITHF